MTLPSDGCCRRGSATAERCPPKVHGALAWRRFAQRLYTLELVRVRVRVRVHYRSKLRRERSSRWVPSPAEPIATRRPSPPTKSREPPPAALTWSGAWCPKGSLVSQSDSPQRRRLVHRPLA